MRKRTLAELNLMDDFLFGKVMSHKDYGKEFGKISETDWKFLDVCGKIRKLYAIKSG